MEKKFVSHDIAVALKELGFDEDCFAHFTNNDLIIGRAILKSSSMLYYRQDNINPSNQYNNCTAPLWQDVIDWFRDIHKLNIEITDWSGSGFYKFEIFNTEDQNKVNLVPIIWWETNEFHEKNKTSSIFTYYEARKAGIFKAIELLKESLKEK